MHATIKRRLTDFGMTLLFLAFYLQFYTLVKLNLHDVTEKKELIACFLFPAVVAIYSLIRFIKTPYIESYVHMVFDTGGENGKAEWYFSFVISVFVLVMILYLTSLALIEKGFMTAGYSQFELVACITCAALIGFYASYKATANMKNGPGRRIISAIIVFGACSSAGWLVGIGLRVLYETIFLYPEVLRW